MFTWTVEMAGVGEWSRRRRWWEVANLEVALVVLELTVALWCCCGGSWKVRWQLLWCFFFSVLRYQSLCFLSPLSVLACSSWFSSFPLYVSVSVLFCSSPFIPWWWLCYWRQDGNRQQLLPFSSSSLCRGASLCFSSSPSVSIVLPLVSILFFLSFSGLLKMFQWLNCHALSFVPSGSQNLPVPFVFFNLLIVRPLSPLLSLYFLLVLSYSFFFSVRSLLSLSFPSFFFLLKNPPPILLSSPIFIGRRREGLPCPVLSWCKAGWHGLASA